LIGLSFSPDPPTVFANNALHNRQTYPRPLEIARLVQPLKNPEKLIIILHIKASPIVFYIIYGFLSLFP